MIKLYRPESEVELSVIKSIFESEDISYFVHNDYFGSLKLGPQIELFNTKMIMVHEDHYEKAEILLLDFLGNAQSDDQQYTLVDKIRMILETLLFSWFVPGKTVRKKKKDD